MSWRVERRIGAARDFHALPLDDPAERLVRIFDVVAPAIVLGSAQREATLRGVAGFDVVRRTSGGGAVFLAPGAQLWVDVTVPRTDPLWNDDVGRASGWLGQSWQFALARLGIVAEIHAGPLRGSAWHRIACFSGVGSGEVLVDGAKLIGISQRRTRSGARFQCVMPLDQRYRRVADHLRLAERDRVALADYLQAMSVSWAELDKAGTERTADVLLEHFLDELRAV